MNALLAILSLIAFAFIVALAVYGGFKLLERIEHYVSERSERIRPMSSRDYGPGLSELLFHARKDRP
jgi:hypothetical protein